MKRYLSFLLVLLAASFCFGSQAALDSIDKTISTTFTASTSAFAGFSKVNVTSAAQLNPADKYSDNDVVTFNFDPVHSQYYTDTFYAYCQAFSSHPLKVTVSAPLTMTPNSGKGSVSYTLVYNATEHSASWTSDTNNKATITESGKQAGARVVMSQPIKILVNATDVKTGKIYSVQFKLEVKAV